MVKSHRRIAFALSQFATERRFKYVNREGGRALSWELRRY